MLALRRQSTAYTMLASFPEILRLPLAWLLLALNTVINTLPLLLLAVIKAAIPQRNFRRWISAVLVRIAENWIANNVSILHLMTRTKWLVEGAEGLQRRGWYLVLSNHQSWVDIPVLQRTFNRRIPFLKFFLKKQLIWVPLLGVSWWALDFPFMQRFSRAFLQKNPQMRGKDAAATRQACERFRDLPVSVMNFVEGTRFTAQKHARQQSPFAHLLRPKAGGSALVLGAMGEILQSLIDVTIVYPDGIPSMSDLLAGRIRSVHIKVRELPIPAGMVGGDYENDDAYRTRFQAWINDLWLQKDAQIALMRASLPAFSEI